MSEILDKAIFCVQNSDMAFCRYITANDTGANGSHQSGFYIPKCASSLLFNKPATKGQNMDRMVTIKWQDEFCTTSRFIYYGKGTRNEYRITRFGSDFPFFSDAHIGDLLIIGKNDDDHYVGYVLSSDEDVDGFLAYFNISSDKTNNLLNVGSNTTASKKIQELCEDIVSHETTFPPTATMSEYARDCYNTVHKIGSSYICNHPDNVLLGWIDAEYTLFHLFEEKFYKEIYNKPFTSCQALIEGANTILNRRKARAGKSLEHHLSKMFTLAGLEFEGQVITEGNKRPDFIFPSSESYHDITFPTTKLVLLGSKTTCKDRWRQVLNEANRIKHKHLFTLQQGISRNQMKEMKAECLTLVVPEPYIASFDKDSKKELLSLDCFIKMIQNIQR